MCVCQCVCVFDPISQRYKAVWQGKRAVEPVIGNFKLLPAMNVRGKLYSNYNNTHTGGGGCLSLHNDTIYSLFPLTGDGAASRHVALEAF